MERRGDIIRNLQRAGDSLLRVLCDCVPNQFAQTFVGGVSGPVGTAHYFLMKTEFGLHGFGGRVADFGHNRHSVTCQR